VKTWHGLPVIDDDFPSDPAVLGHGTGYEGRDYSAFPLNGQSFNRESTVARLSEKEIVELVIEKLAKKSFIVDICDAAGLKPKNQKQSSYCWIHGPTGGMDMDRVYAGHTNPILYHSAFYAGSQIKHGANQGGSGVQGVKWLVEHGTCREELWPPMQFHGTVTDEIKADAAKRQVTICEEFEPGDHIGINSSVVMNQPVTVGVPAWGHEVLVCALVFKDGKPKGDYGDLRRKFRNSWGDWGDKGCGVLDGSKAKLDEAMRVVSIEEVLA
jgi:hypothetical protein